MPRVVLASTALLAAALGCAHPAANAPTPTPALPGPATELPPPAILASPTEPPDGCGSDSTLASEPGAALLVVPDAGPHVVVARDVRTGAWAVVEARPRYRCERAQEPTCPSGGSGVADDRPVARPRPSVLAIEVPARPSEQATVDYDASDVGAPIPVRGPSCLEPP